MTTTRKYTSAASLTRYQELDNQHGTHVGASRERARHIANMSATQIAQLTNRDTDRFTELTAAAAKRV